jgi:putative transcriptional regulator
MVKPINPIKRYWLVELRNEKGLKTREIAERFGISFQHYNDIENGRRNPSFELCIDLAHFFDVPVEKFFEDRTKFAKGEN